MKNTSQSNREAHLTWRSIGKAFTSVACGIMLKEKHDLIPDGLETKVFTEKYLPQALPLDDPAKAEIKLGQLLSMSPACTGKQQPGIVNGIDQKLDPLPRLAGPVDQDVSRPANASLTSPAPAILLFEFSAHCVYRPSESDRHGNAAITFRRSWPGPWDSAHGVTRSIATADASPYARRRQHRAAATDAVRLPYCCSAGVNGAIASWFQPSMRHVPANPRRIIRIRP